MIAWACIKNVSLERLGAVVATRLCAVLVLMLRKYVGAALVVGHHQCRCPACLAKQAGHLPGSRGSKLSRGERRAKRDPKAKCFLCSPSYGRACHWAMLG